MVGGVGEGEYLWEWYGWKGDGDIVVTGCDSVVYGYISTSSTQKQFWGTRANAEGGLGQKD